MITMENMKNKLISKKIYLGMLLASIFLTLAFATKAKAYDQKDAIPWSKNSNIICGYYKNKSAGEVVFLPEESINIGNRNYNKLDQLLNMKNVSTIIIPKGSKVLVNGSLKMTSNKTIIATGATLTFKEGASAVFAAANKSVKNVKIIGGKWRSAKSGGHTGGFFQFAFAKNIVLDGIDCNANYNGHAIELIACENVTVQNCKVAAIGKNPKDCKEEQIQIDIATKKTAPMAARYGAKYAKGQTCKNIYILNNKISGARSVGVNWYQGENGKYINKFHQNIVIKGNTMTSTTSEGLQYFNTIGGEISGNTIKTNATRTENNSSYTIGVHVAICGKAPSAMKKSTLYIQNNVIRGNRNGIYVKAYFNQAETKVLSKLGKVYIKNNKVYCKKGKKNAIVQLKNSCTSFVNSKNKCYNW